MVLPWGRWLTRVARSGVRGGERGALRSSPERLRSYDLAHLGGVAKPAGAPRQGPVFGGGAGAFFSVPSLGLSDSAR